MTCHEKTLLLFPLAAGENKVILKVDAVTGKLQFEYKKKTLTVRAAG